MLLKIFLPLTILIVPILISVNAVGGRGSDLNHYQPYSLNASAWPGVVGLNAFSWGNVRPDQPNRYWAHLIMAVIVIAYCCYTFFDELRGYVRLRQAYLASPQHRLRASATTVLVSGIPRKWCTAEALDGLYDVFPGGIRNIWINRNFDELNEKVKLRNDMAMKLEDAMTNLIKNAKKAHIKELQKEAKKSGQKMSKKEKAVERKEEDNKAAAMADAEASEPGDLRQEQYGEGVLGENAEVGSQHSVNRPEDERPILPVSIPVIGRGVEAVGAGVTNLGKTVFGGIMNVGREVDHVLSTTQGFESSTDDLARQGDAAKEFGSAGHRHQSPDSPTNNRLSPKTAQLQDTQQSTRHSTLEEGFANSALAGGEGQHVSEPNVNLHDNKPMFGEKKVPENGDRAPENRPATADSSKLNTTPLHGKTKYAFWRQPRNAIPVPNPLPHGYRPEDAQLYAAPKSSKHWWEFWKAEKPTEQEDYPDAYDKEYDPNEGDAVWKQYVEPKNRDTTRLPIFGIQALSWLPFVGEKVDTIDYCRKELARLNLEIEHDQKEPEKYPLMNSAFIQFNHQVAAHMACQAVSHHIPMQMAPRAVEISPKDVLWNNMSIKWWERWIRTFLILTLVAGLVIGWAVPVAFTGLLSNVTALANLSPGLAWLKTLPSAVQGIIQGVLPPVLLAILLILLPLVLNLLARLQGVSTGTAAQLACGWYYFFFLFVQVFLVVTIAASITQIIPQVHNQGTSLSFIPNLLANNIPNAANYFFSYILLQALSTSAGVLVQVFGLLGWFVFAPLFDSTARQKWKRQISLPTVDWGTFFPIYTNFACIGLIYSCIAPLMLLFLIITFSLFWFVYRYQTLYITKFDQDTGGLLFPQAINQLFVGLYVMELALIGLFSLVSGVDPVTGSPAGSPCTAQAVIMAFVLICTIVYQTLLNHSFGPLLRYLPITLEDDAVIRDQEFARAQDKKPLLDENEKPGDDINDVLEDRERQSEEADRQAEALELRDIQRRKSRRLNPMLLAAAVPEAVSKIIPGREAWRTRSRSRDRQRTDSSANWVYSRQNAHAVDVNAKPDELIRQHRLRHAAHASRQDAEANPNASIAEALFAGINDEIEDLTPDERDILVRRAFQHEALRARRPVIWIPRDELGVSEDEMGRMRRLGGEYLPVSNEHAALDHRGKVVYRKSPPDFSELDLIQL